MANGSVGAADVDTHPARAARGRRGAAGVPGAGGGIPGAAGRFPGRAAGGGECGGGGRDWSGWCCCLPLTLPHRAPIFASKNGTRRGPRRADQVRGQACRRVPLRRAQWGPDQGARDSAGEWHGRCGGTIGPCPIAVDAAKRRGPVFVSLGRWRDTPGLRRAFPPYICLCVGAATAGRAVFEKCGRALGIGMSILLRYRNNMLPEQPPLARVAGGVRAGHETHARAERRRLGFARRLRH